ncbi:MAG: hypothetical protein KGH65_04980 [Candidatus Micrarchaeota archaeon]|nr:hypothetical protein [Candidatus Micrarchaeota archaeon]
MVNVVPEAVGLNAIHTSGVGCEAMGVGPGVGVKVALPLTPTVPEALNGSVRTKVAEPVTVIDPAAENAVG